MDKIIVKMMEPFRQFNPGDVCGFAPDVAEQLIKKQAAVPFRAPKETARKAK